MRIFSNCNAFTVILLLLPMPLWKRSQVNYNASTISFASSLSPNSTWWHGAVEVLAIQMMESFGFSFLVISLDYLSSFDFYIVPGFHLEIFNSFPQLVILLFQFCKINRRKEKKMRFMCLQTGS